MKLTLDSQKCQGHGRCYALAPELFDLDENGHGLVLVAEIDESHRERAELAVQNCPEQAITLE